MCRAAEEQARQLRGSGGGGNQAEIHGIDLKGFERTGPGLRTVEIDDVEKLAAAFRGEKNRIASGNRGKRRMDDFLKRACIRVDGKHRDLAWIEAGGKQETALEIESHHVYRFQARKRRTWNWREDSGHIVSSENCHALRVSGISREYERLLELRVCCDGTDGQTNQ